MLYITILIFYFTWCTLRSQIMGISNAQNKHIIFSKIRIKLWTNVSHNQNLIQPAAFSAPYMRCSIIKILGNEFFDQTENCQLTLLFHYNSITHFKHKYKPTLSSFHDLGKIWLFCDALNKHFYNLRLFANHEGYRMTEVAKSIS